jgi:two-component system response regulator WspF
MIRVAIVNDLAVACEALRRAIAADPGLSVAWIARDGAQAVDAARRDRPDVVLMDLVMPVMDGVEATRRIMRECPCPILVVTATVSGNATLVYEALGAGALDAVNTPTFGAGGALGGGDALLRRIHRIGRQNAGAAGDAADRASPRAATGLLSTPAPAAGTSGALPRSPAAHDPLAARGSATILAIGASTGGPRAVAQVLAALPRDLPVATLIVQHVSSEFVGGFASWLATELSRPVQLARAGVVPRAGDILVAGEERHMVLTESGALGFRDEPAESLHRPSVDELFGSLAHAPARGIAVLLTGMGRDGAAGLLRLRAAGWHTIAQDERTSVVWGMPGAAHRAGAAVETLSIEAIGHAIVTAAQRLSRDAAERTRSTR